eukprot:GHVP01033739.1.p1 GENE.GHVP01033739.1~~GHVP01033739.1.p1  ORF type:complete len:994 (-),score=197.93 GHVP01033739.1:5261-8242(-)
MAFRQVCDKAGFDVRSFHKDAQEDRQSDEWSIAICTIEKANSIVNNYIKEGNLFQNITCVVVDEVHILGDTSRGPILESLLSKLLFHQKKHRGLTNHEIQIVAMSATLPNLHEIAKWLDACSFEGDYRPIPLSESFVCQGSKNIWKSESRKWEREAVAMPKFPREPPSEELKDFLAVCQSILIKDWSVLVFASSKSSVEDTAVHISKYLLVEGQDCVFRNPERKRLLSNLIVEMQSVCNSLHKISLDVVSAGVGFHHSGLSMEERRLMEKGFRSGAILILVATSTVGAGVNLPARLVVFKTPYVALDFLNSSKYKQMSGRAGRFGQGDSGESVICCSSKDAEAVRRLIENAASGNRLESSLKDNSQALQRLILESLVEAKRGNDENENPKELQVHQSIGDSDDIQMIYSSTLNASQNSNESEKMLEDLKAAMGFLLKNYMLRYNNSSGSYETSPFGKAVCKTYLPPEDAVILYKEIRQASKSIILFSELQLCYLCAPMNSNSVRLNWRLLLELVNRSNSVDKRIIELLGFSTELITIGAQKARDRLWNYESLLPAPLRDPESLRKHKRLFQAFVIVAEIRGTSVDIICSKFQTNIADIQSLKMSSVYNTFQICSFVDSLGFWALSKILNDFRVLLQGNHELTRLLEIPSMTEKLGLELLRRGIKTPAMLASAKTSSVRRVLESIAPKNSPIVAPDNIMSSSLTLAKELQKEAELCHMMNNKWTKKKKKPKFTKSDEDNYLEEQIWIQSIQATSASIQWLDKIGVSKVENLKASVSVSSSPSSDEGSSSTESSSSSEEEISNDNQIKENEKEKAPIIPNPSATLPQFFLDLVGTQPQNTRKRKSRASFRTCPFSDGGQIKKRQIENFSGLKFPLRTPLEQFFQSKTLDRITTENSLEENLTPRIRGQLPDSSPVDLKSETPQIKKSLPRWSVSLLEDLEDDFKTSFRVSIQDCDPRVKMYAKFKAKHRKYWNSAHTISNFSPSYRRKNWREISD